jgi:hypothetical protein
MGGVEVFPSQNYLEDKPKGFSRSLYQLTPKNQTTKQMTTNIWGKLLYVTKNRKCAKNN